MSTFSKKLFWVGLVILLPVSLGLLLYLRHELRADAISGQTTTGTNPKPTTKPTAELSGLAEREQRVAESDWAKETLAQECGRTFESFWDALNAATNKLQLVANFPVGEIALGDWSQPQHLPHGIEVRMPTESRRHLSASEWHLLVEDFAHAGWELVQTEFRHNRFDVGGEGQPRQSRFYFSAHLTNLLRSERAILEGHLVVDWAAKQQHQPVFAVKRIDASQLTLKTRRGEPPFKQILSEQIRPPENSPFIDPLIVYDLDGDGLPEIILPAANRVYRRGEAGLYQSEPLFRHPPRALGTALIADIDGDGAADLLCANEDGLLLFKGSSRGRFDEPGQLVWKASPRLVNPMVLTCGDIDEDGDLALFLGQYRVPNLGQILKPHFYDANDGHPAYLLLNDGHGNFRDASADSGLEMKRGRRVLSASFVHLDTDDHLDLMVVSDFAGLDLYRNDGHGHFTDMTRQWIAEPHAFGMGHALADFNGDGRLDLLMIGMTSPTVDRLDHLGLKRRGATEDPTMRNRMTYGNRLYVARPGGGFEQTTLGDAIARTGWSWGCSAFDFDNDGYPDLFIANGNETKKTVRDYESEFWLHDIYIDNSVDDVSATTYLTSKFARTRGNGWSYGGYEKNRLFLNREGQGFLEVAHLFGVALELDTRNVVATDLDGDGRVDLAVLTNEVWPEKQQTLRVYENRLANAGHWLGFRFREGGQSPVGACITLRWGTRSAVRQVVTGDSLRSQHPNTLHFGLGTESRVDRAEIQWTDGRRITLDNPAADRYHRIPTPQ